MVIYSNEGNPFGLKFLILAKYAKLEVTLKTIALNDAKALNLLILPTLEFENGLRLFSSQAIIHYLFPKQNSLDDKWLEWSLKILAPTLFHNRTDFNNDSVKKLLRKINEHLKSSTYLLGDQIKPVDFAIWALLAPEALLHHIEAFSSIFAWYQKIKELEEVQQILVQYPLNKFTWNAVEYSNSYGGLPLDNIHKVIEAEKNTEINTMLTTEIVTEKELQLAKKNFVFTPKEERQEDKTVLPKPGERNILITSALPYVNNVPHLGNIIGCVLSADIFARYSRSVGYNTLYICGTDEYGTATENKAIDENLSPREICDKYFEFHNSIYRWFGIGFDYFGRTTTQEQTEIVQDAFNEVYNNGYIQSESVEQLLCQKCDRYLADRFVEGICPHPGCGSESARGDQCDKCGKLVNAIDLMQPRCKVCGSTPVIKSSNQLFLNLPKIEPKLQKWIDSVENGWTYNARVITRGWLREGLKPRCISRDLKWGIPVPLKGFENKVFYVWFDAPFGYISMTKKYTKEYKQWWQPSSNVEVELFQFMAKDNVPFHSVMWPSTLLAINQNYVLVSHIMATEYLNYENGKFSKSRGIGVFGNDAQDSGIPADIWRFYLASARPESQDSNFSWMDLATRNNSELLNNLGNFVNRALVFCEKNFNSIIADIEVKSDDLNLIALINRELQGYISAMETAKLRDGIRYLLAISRHGNVYMQVQQPWVLLKGNAEEKLRAASVVSLSCNIACLLANLLYPYMPTTSRNIFQQLNVKQTHLNAGQPFLTILLPTGHQIGKPFPLFTKLEQNFITELQNKYSGVQKSYTNEKVSCNKKTLTITELEIAVRNQGDKVRELKASTKDKKVWQPEVNILLDLKKQLAALQLSNDSNATTNKTINKDQISELENQIKTQGDKVRELKATVQPNIWKPQLEILLNLKKQLSTLKNEIISKDKTDKPK